MNDALVCLMKLLEHCLKRSELLFRHQEKLTNDSGLQNLCSQTRSWLSSMSDHLSLRLFSIAIVKWIRSGGQLYFVDSASLLENDNGVVIALALISMLLLILS